VGPQPWPRDLLDVLRQSAAGYTALIGGCSSGAETTQVATPQRRAGGRAARHRMRTFVQRNRRVYTFLPIDTNRGCVTSWVMVSSPLLVDEMGSRDNVRMGRRPKMCSTVIAATASVALLVAFLPGTATASRLDVSSIVRTQLPAVGADSWKLLRATNESRGRFALPKLRLNRELSVIARHHSVAMARSGELFHTADVDVYFHAIDWHIWGENVGYTPQEVPSVQRAFMDSPPHREHILNRSFHQVAIGSVRVEGMLWVTVFFFG
jgi:uncharacterized protein YkwD